MSVYTPVTRNELEHFLERYDIGKLVEYHPIAAGITNTNYTLDTESGSYVLTLYEHHSGPELDYMLGLQLHLADQSVRCSEPVTDRYGKLYSNLHQRPAAIINRLPGAVQKNPTTDHCAQIGAELARFHKAGIDYPGRRSNPRGINWVQEACTRLKPMLERADLHSITGTLEACCQFDLTELPHGAIHADLFHDNALFQHNRLGGIFDFDYACNDCFVLDIAVVLNDWCIDSQGQLVESLTAATMAAYQQQRSLEYLERQALPVMLRLAALRFWLSRLHDKHFPLSGELTFIKNPDEYRQIHRLRSGADSALDRLLFSPTAS